MRDDGTSDRLIERILPPFTREGYSILVVIGIERYISDILSPYKSTTSIPI